MNLQTRSHISSLWDQFLVLPKPLRRLSLLLLDYQRQRKLRNLRTPAQLTLFVTNRCNARCEHCFYAGELFKGHELTISQYERFFSSLMTPLDSILLTGGEPFMRQDLPEICRLFALQARRKKIVIPTNGSRTDRILSQLSQILAIPGLELEMQISLDGFKETHDAIRKVPGLFEEAITTVRKISEMHPQIRLAFMTTLWEKNVREAVDLAKWVKDQVGIGHKFQLVRLAGKGVYGVPSSWMETISSKEEALGSPSLPELGHLMTKLQEVLPPSGLFDHIQWLKNQYAMNMLTEGTRALHCCAGVLDAVIYPDGQVAICEMTRSFGLLEDYGFDFNRLWHSPEAREARQLPNKCFCIHSCNLLRSIPFDRKSLKILAGLESGKG